MKRPSNLFSQMRTATRTLLGGKLANGGAHGAHEQVQQQADQRARKVASVIEQALASSGLLPKSGAPAAAPPGPVLRDINPPPAGPASAQAAGALPPATPEAPPQAAWAGIPASDSSWTTSSWPGLSSLPKFNADGSLVGSSQSPQEMAQAAQDFAQDFMARLGVPNSFDLSSFDLPGMGGASKADAALAPGAQFITGTFENHAGKRDYKLYIPSNYQGQPVPLVVMLHGCTQNPDDFAAGTQMNAVAEEKHCLVLYPAQSSGANNSRCWNWFNALDQQRDQGEPSIIAGLTQQIIEDYPVDERQVFVAGLSAGGAMAVIIGTLYPDLFAAVGVHSGLPFASARDLPSALAAMRSGGMAAPLRPTTGGGGLPIIVFHGDRDTTVNPRNGEELIAQGLRDQVGHHVQAAASVDSGSVPNGHSYTRTTHLHQDGTPLGEHWVIHGAGHAWSGGSESGSYTDRRGPDASREMMRFFETVS